MRCKSCGNEIPEGSLFCMFCGSAQKRQRAKKDEISVPEAIYNPASNMYELRVMVDGQRQKIKAPTKKAAEAEARAIKAGLIAIKNNASKAKLTDIIQSYVDANEAVLSPATVRGYLANKRQIEPYATGTAGNTDYQRLINQLSEKYAPKTVHNIWGTITAALGYKKITIPDVNLPPLVKSERNFLDAQQLKIFLDAVRGRSIELVALLALHSLRQSEILALKKDSVKNGVITVKGAVVMDKNNNLVSKETNKTLSSQREVPIMIPRLQELWDALPGDPVFPHPSNIRDDLLRICSEAALPPCSAHNLRHTFCSLAYYLGWDIKSTMSIGGWSSPDVPQRIYAHLSTERKQNDIVKMQDFFAKIWPSDFQVIDTTAV